MCFHEQLHRQKNKASRHLRRQKTHFRQAAYHLKALYSSRFSGTYLFFTFIINTTHSTCLETLKKIYLYQLINILILIFSPFESFNSAFHNITNTFLYCLFFNTSSFFIILKNHLSVFISIQHNNSLCIS